MFWKMQKPSQQQAKKHMNHTFKLFISTPDAVLFEGEAVSLSLPGGFGYMEILADHADIISLVNTGKVTIIPKDKQSLHFDSVAGFFQMKDNQATLLLHNP